MPQDGGRQVLDVVGDDIRPVIEQGRRLGGSVQRQRGAGAGPQLHVGVLAGRFDDVQQIVRQSVVKANGSNGVLQRHHLVAAQRRLYLVDRLAVAVARQDQSLGGSVGVAQLQPDQESVELAFRKRVSALELVGVLGRQNEERRTERPGLPVHRHLPV